jgi:hypothetical protein
MSMGIYLPNMEMPTEGYIDVRIKCNGTASFAIANNPCFKAVEAVPVPPHGRLIDADALMHEFDKAQQTMQQHGREYSCSFMSSSQELSTEWYCVEDMVENAPTIIPAEEGEA